MKVGLFFGSFNPFHVGHMIIASFIRSQIVDNKSIRYLVPDAVYDYLEKTGIYDLLLSKKNDEV